MQQTDEGEMMTCPECGHTFEPGAQFCPKCCARIETPGLWRRFLSWFHSGSQAVRPVVNIQKTISIKTTDKDGTKHEYHSLEEVPPELRAEIQWLKDEALKEKGHTVVSEDPAGLSSRIVSEKKVTVFRIKDASGNERTYHSLEELPPEIRAAIENAQGREH